MVSGCFTPLLGGSQICKDSLVAIVVTALPFSLEFWDGEALSSISFDWSIFFNLSIMSCEPENVYSHGSSSPPCANLPNTFDSQ